MCTQYYKWHMQKKINTKKLVPYLIVSQTIMLFFITVATLSAATKTNIIECRMTSPATLVCIQ